MLPTILSSGGPLTWLLLLVGAGALVVFLERFLAYHRAQINCAEFLNGVRTVLQRNNVVEALSICDATHGPVARLVKVAIKNREKSLDGIQLAVEEAVQREMPALEERLSLLATVAQIAPLLGLLGAVFALIGMVGVMREQAMAIHPAAFAEHIYGGLCSTALGLAIAIVNYAAYNFLVRRLDAVIHDMQMAITEVLGFLTAGGRPS